MDPDYCVGFYYTISAKIPDPSQPVLNIYTSDTYCQHQPDALINLTMADVGFCHSNIVQVNNTIPMSIQLLSITPKCSGAGSNNINMTSSHALLAILLMVVNCFGLSKWN
ncbi:hypothetical protein HDU76_010796 [Blyttiomyces sp. JEL0837]|nr:hypothetical protein HDU76_010796 [Blyttiomyces sp. JEL0837]